MVSLFLPLPHPQIKVTTSPGNFWSCRSSKKATATLNSRVTISLGDPVQKPQNPKDKLFRKQGPLQLLMLWRYPLNTNRLYPSWPKQTSYTQNKVFLTIKSLRRSQTVNYSLSSFRGIRYYCEFLGSILQALRTNSHWCPTGTSWANKAPSTRTLGLVFRAAGWGCPSASYSCPWNDPLETKPCP